MFWLQPSIVKKFDLKEAESFVFYWHLTHSHVEGQVELIEDERTDADIDYMSELNIGKPLSAENVKQLLLWKDSNYTYTIHGGADEGRIKPKTQRILKNLATLNKFRNGKISEKVFKTATGRMVESGYMMRLFLFHICRPHEYPLVNRDTLRSFSCHTGAKVSAGFDFKHAWVMYQKYKEYVLKIAQSYELIPRKLSLYNDAEKLMEVFNALVGFGEFLTVWGRDWHYSEDKIYD